MKKGISPLVATSFLIVIVMIIATIIWFFLSAKFGLEARLAYECKKASNQLKLVDTCKYSKVGTRAENISVIIERKPTEEAASIKDIQLIARTKLNEKFSARIAPLYGKQSIPKVGKRKRYDINVSGLILYLTHLGIAPIIEIEGKERICNIQDEQRICWCENFIKEVENVNKSIAAYLRRCQKPKGDPLKGKWS
ncbi:hypothetical protein D6829_02710 [Candidatus Pacearchaeota archaeon]|nr:MAG: hypothetical protein D6829_02710 [Candidatus Pacearchaeota archaeon]